MKLNTKSSITLPPDELALVEELRKKFHAKSKVEIIRRGLQLLKESSDRQSLREAYQKASSATRVQVGEVPELSDEGLD